MVRFRPVTGPPTFMGAPLEGFPVAQLPFRTVLLAAALAQGQPTSPQILAECLCRAGISVTAGEVEKAARGVLRVKPGGWIEPVPDHPDYWETVYFLSVQHRDHVPRPEAPRPSARPYLETQPIGREELESARELVGPFWIGHMAVRRELMLYCDSRGGRASLVQLCQDHERFSDHPVSPWLGSKEQQILQSLHSGRDGSLLFDGNVASVVSLDPGTRKGRRQFREWACRIQGRAHFTPIAECGTGRPAILRSLCWRGKAYAVVLDCVSGRAEAFYGTARLSRALTRYGLLVGIDPEKELRQLKAHSQVELVKLLPPSGLSELNRRMWRTVGLNQLLARPSDLRKLADTGSQALLAALMEEARALYRLFRFGRLHGYILAGNPFRPRQQAVSWHQGEASLEETLRRLSGQAHPLHLCLRLPTRVCRWLQVESLGWVKDGLEIRLPTGEIVLVELHQIVDCYSSHPHGLLEGDLVAQLHDSAEEGREEDSASKSAPSANSKTWRTSRLMQN